ncbi:MAG TPA: PhnD/SsuA/transferrin family substrate-binding protein [Burkholderiales bacterium]|nr:PhnD/SsuA/transferrin family substrate-binding protein [Burkholderiales bacterium]
MKLQLSIGMAANPRSAPIFDGRVQPDGIELVPSEVFPSELFWRQLKFGDFDIAEMSMSTLMMAVAAGDDRWLGIPVFTTRKLFHTELLVRRAAGIEKPADLKGKRVGVPEYQQTAALWTRGALEHEFGVYARDMEWWMERVPSHSHRGAIGFTPPPGVTIRQVPAEKNLGTMMLAGELDATVHYIANANLVDRSRVDLWNHPEIRSLFPDPVAEGVRYYKKTGLLPINHGMVVKRSLAERHPWIVLNVLKAFERANEIAERERLEHAQYHVATGLASAQALRTPLVRHGVEANRLVLDTAAQYSEEQGLTPRRVRLEEVFAPSTLDQ